MHADKTFSAFLFDMDGTLLDSIVPAERVWARWAQRHGIEPEALLRTIHGKRASDSIRALNLAGVDPQVEAEWILQGEMEDTDGIVAIDGIGAFLAALPAERCAIVTSAPLGLAKRRLEAAGITPPPVIVSGEDVTIGKPAPDCFLLAAKRLGVDIGACLVFEDAPAGIAAAEAAGASVMIITATHRHPVEIRHPSIATYEGIGVLAGAEGLRLELRSRSSAP